MPMPISGAGKSEGYPWALAMAVNARWQIRPAGSASSGVPGRRSTGIGPSAGWVVRAAIERSFLRCVNPTPARREVGATGPSEKLL